MATPLGFKAKQNFKENLRLLRLPECGCKTVELISDSEIRSLFLSP